ncbi:hypothetical protein KKE06_02505 [Candidatus Micrarchaeota archaeon]|nr:hypothetical protein [Candidatus Micrarchaeota archaeon]MBU1930672.1 hypothetical protein [Candidatus Micrarchaeota archaeon]
MTNRKNEKGQIECYIPFFIMLIMVLGLITASMQNDIRHGYCNLFGHDPVPDGEPSIRLLCSDDSDIFNFRARVEREVKENGGDQAAADMIIDVLKEQITFGLESVPPDVVVYSSCWVTTDLMGQVWDGRASIHDDCPAKGQVCKQVSEDYAECVDPPPNSPGTYYACNDAFACVATECGIGTVDQEALIAACGALEEITDTCLNNFCQNLNEGGCNEANHETHYCGAIAGPCVADCKGNAWEIACGERVLNNTQEEIDSCAAAEAPLTCPGGTMGYACTDPNSYCDVEAGICEPIEFALCDEDPSSSLKEIDPLLSVTDDSVDCGTTAPDGKLGTKCSSDKICDIIGESCFDPAASALTQKYEFDTRGEESNGIGINFMPITNTDFRYPQFCIPENSIYCPSCAFTPDGGSQILSSGLVLSYDRLRSKAGSLHFSMAARGISGLNNYALIQYNDVQQEGDDKEVSSERFVVQVDAGQYGECMVESQQFTGAIGIGAKTLVEYTWNWNNIGKSFCEVKANNPAHVPRVCDGTQFFISLLSRLHEIKTELESGAPPIYMTDFNAFLMPDSFNADFRKDFDAYYSTVDQSTPSWYADVNNSGFSRFVHGSSADTNHLSFVGGNTIGQPGKYRVFITIVGGEQFFDAQGNPDANIIIGFQQVPTPEIFNVHNALYYLPLDGAIGTIDTNEEPIPSREGYGIALSGSQIAFNEDQQNPIVVGNQQQTSVTKLTTFDATNDFIRRGQLLNILIDADGINQIVFSPVIATPVAMKIPGIESPTTGKYYLGSPGSGPYEAPGHPSLTAWTGIASKQTNPSDPFCSDFQNQPLKISQADEYILEDSIGYRSLKFENPDQEIEKFLVFSTVFYLPGTSTLTLNHAVGDNAVLITPNQLVPNPTTTATLNFTESLPIRPGYLPNGLKVHSVQDLVNLANLDVGAICVYSQENDSGNIETVFFWNRSKLLQELNDRSDTPFSEPQTNPVDIRTGFGITHDDWFCD